jgi:O-methyltransferase
VINFARDRVEMLRARVAGSLSFIQEARTSDIAEDRTFQRLYDRCRSHTMTSISRMYATYQATCHVVRNRIPGDIVECGVWQGGSSMMIALTLLEQGDTHRTLHLYDTYAGMTPPTHRDVSIENRSARTLLELGSQANPFLARATLDVVQANMAATGYPLDRVAFIQGPVEETLPDRAPAAVALLRLDTDWYESTYHELVHLYPRLTLLGPLLVDDYGYWRGAREAVDQYFAENGITMLLTRTDWSGRLGIKTG